MTKEELGQLIDLRKEIKELEHKIAVLSRRKGKESQDRVSASYNEFPYIKGHATVSGYIESVSKAEIDNIIYLLEQRMNKAAESERRITEYINTIEDSKIRRMMQYRYIDGCTLGEIGEYMHCDRTTVEKTITKYLNEYK